MANLTISLIRHKRITTTLAKAKALRVYAEPLITKAKSDTMHSRRTVYAYLRDKDSIQELFSTVAEKVGGRPGGYTRILKLGTRAGDNAEMALIELVDFNEYTDGIGKKQQAAKPKTRRGRAAKGSTAKGKVSDGTVEAKVEEAPAEGNETSTETENAE